MQTEKITINNQELTVLGAIFETIRLWEETTGRSIQTCRSTYDALIYFYCNLRANNPEFTTPFDEFVRQLDEQPEILADFQTLEIAQKKPLTDEPKTNKKKQPTSLKSTFALWMLIAKVGKKLASLRLHSV